MRKTIVATFAATAITFGGVGVAHAAAPKLQPALLSWLGRRRTRPVTVETATRPDCGGCWASRVYWVWPGRSVETIRPCAPTSGPIQLADPDDLGSADAPGLEAGGRRVRRDQRQR
jgi:hypothetical protein